MSDNRPLPKQGTVWMARPKRVGYVLPSKRDEWGHSVGWNNEANPDETLLVIESKGVGKRGNKHNMAITKVMTGSGEVTWIESSWLIETNPGCWQSDYYTRIA